MTMTRQTRIGPLPPASGVPEGGVDRQAPSRLPHQCDGDAVAAESRRAMRRRADNRVVGIDVARAVALVGMMAVHVLPDVDGEGDRSLPFLLASGNSAALFAVLAGLGVGLTTGRSTPPTGRRWTAAAVNLVVRTGYIGAVGLALGFVSSDNAMVILPYYAVLFLMMIPILRNPAWVNLAMGVGIAVAGPILSHALRSASTPLDDVPNLTFADLVGNPGQSLTTLLLTGAFPAVGWFAYVCIGLGIGRMRLQSRRTAVVLLVGGLLLAALGNLVSWVLMDVMGGRTALADVASRTMDFEEFTDILVWGAGGTLPTDTWWWLAVLAPHTTTPVDLMYSAGVAVAVLGACLALGWVIPDLLRPIAIFGSMPLSMYAGHLLLLQFSPFRAGEPVLDYLMQIVLLFMFAVMWKAWLDRGPLEWVMGRLTSAATRVTGPRRAPVRAGA